jgi:hypothetical protein
MICVPMLCAQQGGRRCGVPSPDSLLSFLAIPVLFHYLQELAALRASALGEEAYLALRGLSREDLL